MNLNEQLRSITPESEPARKAALQHWDSLAKPLGSLGELEHAVTRIAALTGTAEVQLQQRSLLVFCADNGVVAQGVSQSGPDVTTAVTTALGAGISTVNYMAQPVNCKVIPVDVGVLDLGETPGVLARRIRNGTGDISVGPAMTHEECIRAIETGMELVRERKEAGDRILCIGEMGIGNTTTSSAVACLLLGREPEQMAGRGAGLSDEGLVRKIRTIRSAIEVNRPNPDDPVDILSKVGGLDLAALCGAVLGGALYEVPVLLDGLITDVAAVCAYRLCPNARKAMLASHCSAEPAAEELLKELQLEPFIRAGLRLGEGSGAVAALTLLDQALNVYHSGHTFGHLGIDAYTPQ